MNWLRDSGIRISSPIRTASLFAEPRPRFGVYAPIVCPASRVAALGARHRSSNKSGAPSKAIPRDYNYREFYRDVGFDLGL